MLEAIPTIPSVLRDQVEIPTTESIPLAAPPEGLQIFYAMMKTKENIVNFEKV